ncbi:two-component system LytT family sensor kinase [Desulfohalotomaculum tongense]|uniref:histidine kinase n=1 Tax=Desulforadius tongensis TaxID=1216062 RepID=UPI001EE53456|nr:histidine kinase [Desulforadius tongensis]MBM7854885.1 two-component system LytT family sensor kinase [Desulforadius tongensis]
MKQKRKLQTSIITRFVLLQFLVLAVLLLFTSNWQVILILMLGNCVTFYLVVLSPSLHRGIAVKVDAKSFDRSLQIANETLPFLRRGLNSETAQQTAEIIQKISDVPAVALTDRHYVLAFLGAGCERHPPGGSIITNATKEVIATGQLKIIEKKEDFNCPYQQECDCPLESAVIAPLKCKGEVVGTVKLYQTKEGEIPSNLVKLAVGIAQLLGVQVELAELDRQAQLVTKAELDALQAQINPHFLFNTLNTISMFIRTNPETARRLLKRLAAFFRHSLKRRGHLVTLAEELEYLHNYLVLEKARFREKLRVKRDIDHQLLKYKIPVLTLQPLVENSIRHGITPKVGPGTVKISARLNGGQIHIEVHDDGVGIEPETMPKVLKPGFGSGSGVGLSNVHERLKILFGEEYGLKITSTPGQGTSVFVRVPLIEETSEEGGKVDEVKSVDSG